uniref:ARC105/Med15 mediator subunit central domain-containing protein n=1 Tax=Neogobius melanostomus TaxID=47308 RepID=A0A8C6TY93_9GOBI
MMSSPSPLQPQTPQNMPPPPQPSPQPSSQPNSVSSGPTPSPSGGFQPSPSPQPSQSPSTARTPQSYSAASPGTLNTPGNPSSVMSPGAQSLEDQQYMEKLKQLSKYVEPLSRMITRSQNEVRYYYYTILLYESLLNILTRPHTSLAECEIAWRTGDTTMAPDSPPRRWWGSVSILCRRLLDAVMFESGLPCLITADRTFAPPMARLHGPPHRVSSRPLTSTASRSHVSQSS